MCILERMQQFAVNGVRAFHKASKGQYHSESEAVKALKMEMMTFASGRHNDVENLTRDKRNVEADVRRSFNNLILKNG